MKSPLDMEYDSLKVKLRTANQAVVAQAKKIVEQDELNRAATQALARIINAIEEEDTKNLPFLIEEGKEVLSKTTTQ
jgi:hypothetical protein